MGITDPAATPGPPLLARLWPRVADRLAGRAAPDLIDWAIAAGCFAAFTVPVLLGAGPARPPGAGAVFGALAAAPLVARRRWPVPVVLVVAAVYVAATLADVAFTPFISNAGPNLAIAVFTAADRSRRLWSLTAAAVAAAVTWASLPVAIQLHPHHDQDAVQLFAVIAAWLAGDMVRALRGYRQQLQLIQRRRAVEELQLARAEERLRLSREVHDVVSHSLSTIAVQAGVARLVLAEQPGQAGTALSAIETASRSALDELRNLLRQIRDPQELDEAAMPTLSDLPALIGKLRQAGLDVSYRSTGQPRPYSTAVELSAYRIAQEALTNVTKHASGARTRVEVGHGASELTLTVTDGGGPDPVRPAAGGGLGIPGMRERAELLGGTLTAGPGPDGGFTVTARLPVQQGRDGMPAGNGRPGLPGQHTQGELT
ncbi:MAG: sensor histidine kinase [Actinobacteria bacterium]|nr:sensor histidine kinase [Actinomycetota bacterium]